MSGRNVTLCKESLFAAGASAAAAAAAGLLVVKSVNGVWSVVRGW